MEAERLEKKVEGHFAALERRVLALEKKEEEGIAVGVPADVKDRLLEIEDLLLLTQSEIMHLREGIGGGALSSAVEMQQGVSQLDERIAAIEQKITEFASSDVVQKEIAPVVAKLDMRFRDFERAFDEGKAQVTTMDAQVRQNERRLDEEIALRAALDTATRGIEKRMDDALARHTVLDTAFRETDKRLGETAAQWAGVDTQIKQLEQRLDSEVSLRASLEASGQGAEQRLDELSRRMAALDAGHAWLQRRVEDDVADIRAALQESGRLTGKDIAVYVDRLKQVRDSVGEELSKLKAASDELSALRKEGSDWLERVAEADINAEKSATYFEKMKVLGEKTQTDLDRMASMRDATESKLKFTLERVDIAKKDVEAKTQAMDEKFRLRMEKVEAARETLDNKLRALEEKAKDFRQIEDLSSFQRMIEEETVARTSMEKHFADLSQRMTSLEGMASDLEEESVARNALEKKVQDIQARLERREKMREDLVSLKRDIEATAEHYRAELETAKQNPAWEARFAGIEQKMAQLEVIAKDTDAIREQFRDAYKAELAQLSEHAEQAKASVQEETKRMETILQAENVQQLRDDIAQQKKLLQALERNLEASAIKFFSSNLDDFAKTLDRRIPNLVTKDEYLQDMKDIIAKLRSIQSPDLAPVARRVDTLEKKVNDIYQLTMNVSSRVPVVVE